MRSAVALLLLSVLPAFAAEPQRQSRQRAEKSIVDLRPELVLLGGLYETFQSAAGIFCHHATGEIYVADPLAGTIDIFDENGAPLFSFADEERLKVPTRVAVDDEDRIYVIDSDNTRIKTYDYRGDFLAYLDLPGFAPEDKPIFTAIAFDANGDLYVGESKSGQVIAYDRRRNPKLKVGTYGDGPGQFTGIVGIALDEKHVYVASADGVAVHVFSRQGRLLRSWGRHDSGLENVSLPSAIGVDAKGRVILLDTLRQEIKYFAPDGRLIDLFGGFGRQPGAVAYPTDLSMDRRGRLCVADKGNRRAQILAPVDAPPPGASP